MAPPVGTLRVGPYFLALLGLLALLYSIVFFGPRQTPKLGIDLIGGTEVTFTANGGTPSHSRMVEARQIIADRVNGSGVTQSTVVIRGSNQLLVSIPGHDAGNVKKLGAAAVLNFRGLVAPAVAVTCAPTGSATSSASPGANASTGSSASTSPTGSPSPGASTSAGASSSAKAAAGPSASSGPGASTTGKAAGNPIFSTPTASAEHGAPVQAAAGAPAAAGYAAAANVRPLDKATSSATSAAKSTGTASPKTSATPSGAGASSTPSPSVSGSAVAPPQCSATSVAQAAKAGNFTVPLDSTAYDSLSAANKQSLAAALAGYDCPAARTERDDPNAYFVACGKGSEGGLTSANAAFLLGPVIVAGKQIDTAAATAPNAQQGELNWSVTLSLKSSGQSKWADYTTKHNVNNATSSGFPSTCGSSGTPCADYVAFTLDGVVISAPVNNSAINGGSTQVTGNFNPATAKDLANKLKYGALPLSFTAQNPQFTSATLGSSQLKAGLLAGGIGLALVVIYSMLYYRALGLVTIASLIVSGALTYGCLVMLATQIGFTLSLAGIAGFIVAVGITADSFVVFFERLKDEVHEGRSARVAVPRAWVRARRTILSADTVSFLAAAILYYFTTDEIRGFAFTLGLSTILDLIVVFLFTHPLVSVLSRATSFGSARFTGLDSVRAGAPDTDTGGGRESGGRPERLGRSATARGRTSTAVLLEKPTVDDEQADDPVDAVEPGPVAPPVGQEPDLVLDPDDPNEPRRRTAPEPGSAAERAAARRARLRAERDEKGRG